MQTNRMLAQVDEDIFEVPTEEEGAQVDEDIFQVQPDAFPVEQPDLTPREWIAKTLSNLIPSAWQNVKDTLGLVRPFGTRASGEVSLIPGIADLARLAAEATHRGDAFSWRRPVLSATAVPGRLYTELDEALFGGVPQQGDETPMMDAAVDYFAGRYNFNDPDVRSAFMQVLSEDPVGVMTDLATIPSLAFAGAGGVAAGATRTGRAYGRVAKSVRASGRLPKDPAAATPTARIADAVEGAKTAAAFDKYARIQTKMGEKLGWAQTANRVINEGFHIPGIPMNWVRGKRRMQVRPDGTYQGLAIHSGVADVIDPGVWALRGLGRAGQLGLRGAARVASRAASPYAKHTQRSQQEALVRQGFSDTVESDEPLARIFAQLEEGQEIEGFQDVEGHPIRRAAGEPPLEPQQRAVFDEDIEGLYVPLSLQNTAKSLLEWETRRYDKEYAPIVEAVTRAEEQLNTRVQEIVERVHTDGDLDAAATAMVQAYREVRLDIMSSAQAVYEAAGAEPGLVMDMRPVFDKLEELRAEERAAGMEMGNFEEDLEAGIPRGTFYGDKAMQNLATNVYGAAVRDQNKLSPAWRAARQRGDELTPVARDAREPATQVEDRMYGVATRMSIDVNTGRHYPTQYRVVELEDVVTSHRVDGSQTPNYKRALQVKDMGESASQAKVRGIARNLIPDQILGSNRAIQQGAPITTNQRMVISGNHRINALRVARIEFPEKYAQYIAELKREAPQFGIHNVDSFEAPVLIRVIRENVMDDVALAHAANVSDVQQLSETAQASQDAGMVTDDILTLFDAGDASMNLDEALQASRNEDFRRGFINQLADSEKATFVGEGDQLRTTGLRRLRNAVTAKLFSGQYGAVMRATFTEIPTQGFKNIQTGIENALPALLRMYRRLPELADAGVDYNIAEPLAEAVMKIRNLVEDQETGAGVQRAIAQYLEQEYLSIEQLTEADEAWRVRELDETGRTLLRLLARGVRRPSLITAFLRDYANAISRLSAETTQLSAFDDAAGGSPLVPAEEFVATYVGRVLDPQEDVDKALSEGLDEFFQGEETEYAQPRERAETVTRPKRQYEQRRPILFENVISYRNALARQMLRGREGPNLREWRAQLLEALDESILDTLQAANPDKAHMAVVANRTVGRTQEWLNTTFGQMLADLTDGSRNPSDPAVQRALQSVFTPDDTPRSAMMKYHLLGGFSSDASRRVRRQFLSKLFGFIRTPTGQADAGAIARGEVPIGDVSNRYQPQGISKFLNQFSAAQTDFSQATLRAILGQRTLDDLNDMDIILQNFGRFMKSTNKNELFFIEGAQRAVMSRVLSNIAWKLSGGTAGGIGGGLLGGIPGSIAGGVVGFLVQWLGSKASSRVFEVFYNSDRTKRALLNGIELGMRDAWSQGSRVLLRGAVRTARTASKREDEE